MMQIHRIELDHVEVPFSEPIRIGDSELTVRSSILIRVYEEDWMGLGEIAPPLSAFAQDENDPIERAWEEMVGPVLTHFFQSQPENFYAAIKDLASAPGSPEVRSGLETALWDLEGQKQNCPIYQLLDGKKNIFEGCLVVGLHDNVDSLLEQIRRYLVSDGYRRVKVRIQPGWDEEPLSAIRQHLPRNLKLMADAAGSYDPSDRQNLIALESFDLQYIEDPFPEDAIEACPILHHEMRTPICLGKRLLNSEAIHQAVARNACQVVSLSPARLGGLLETKRLAKWLEREGIPAMTGSAMELGIGSMAGLHVQSLSGMFYPTDISSSFRWYQDELIRPWLSVRGGEFNLSKSPGLGILLSEKALKQYSQKTENRFRRNYVGQRS